MTISRWLNRFGKRIRNIFKGWYFLAIRFDPPFARKRRKICRACNRLKFGVCTECGCPIYIKPRVKEESCPIGKW